MPQAKGYLSKLVIDAEDTFGQTPAVPAGKVMPINSWNVKGDRKKQQAGTLTGSRNPVEPFDGNMSVGGSAVVPIDSVAFGQWLCLLLGAPTTTGSSAPYTHTFKIGTSQPSFVAEKQFATTPATYIKNNGCKIGKLGMKFGGDGELTAALDILGATEAVGTTSFHASPTAIGLSKRFSNFMASIKEGGSTIATVTDCEINLDSGLDDSVYVIGAGGTRGDIPEGLMGISGKLTALFGDKALLDKAANSTESSLEVTLTYDANTSLAFKVPELQFELNTPGIDGPKGILVELPFIGYWGDDAGNSAFQAILKNAQAAYTL